MLMYVAVAALAAVANAQVLRISPAVIGASSAGTQQVIQLGAGGSRALPVARVLQAQPVARVLQAQPIAYTVAAPQQIVTLAPKPIAIAQAIRPVQYVAAQVEREAPAPFAFAFDSEDEFGTKLGRQENANEQGVVTGQYTLADASGVARVVKYIADDNGFRAEIQTNEPGTLTSAPAGVQITSTAQ